MTLAASDLHQYTHLPSSGRRTPVSTYRLQLGPGLTFDQARAQLDYLDDLGITDLYLSPILQAAPGSTHGYDVVDHAVIAASMGGRTGFERLADAAHARGMGIIVDVVPNHMGVPTPIYHNKALWSILKDGPASPHAAWFDESTESGNGVLMPVLGARIGTVLANGEITLESRVIPGLEADGPQPVLVYFDHVFPVRAGTETLPLPLCVQEQFYRLAYWKVADEELNFRRFFDVDTLVAVRVEDPEVFDATHALLLELFCEGRIDGFRIDHPDGLADPRGYLRRLAMATGGAWIAAEKILEDREELPCDWPVAGTTGYDASWRISALHCDPNGAGDLASIAHLITGDIPGTLPMVMTASKREVATTSLFAEVHRLATLADAICRDDIMLRDHTFSWIRACLTEMIVALDRYRAYIVPGELASDTAIEIVNEAARLARVNLSEDLHETLDIVVDLILGREVGAEGRAQREQRDELIIRFQQVCGAVTAKGVEDTAFYRWTHLTSLNEVGSKPDAWGINPDEFHQWASAMADEWPGTMTCGTTHDTKRSEDVRSRIGVLAQFSSEWRALLTKLHPYAEGVEGHTENLLWQTLVGTWTAAGPIERERLQAYMVKASREQKLWTSWTHPDSDRERELSDFIKRLYANSDIMGAFDDWYEFTNDSVRTSILSRKATQLTCLGVADNYQGCETLQNYLVDPDNRQPADFERLAATAAALDTRPPQTLAEEKQHLTREILRLRRRRRDAFVGPDAAYRPLPSSTGHATCFARGHDPQVVTIAARLHRVIEHQHGFTEHTVVLPEGRWRDVLTDARYVGGSVLIADLLCHYPAAVLERTSAPSAADAQPEIAIPLFRPGVRHQPTPTQRPRAESDTEVTGLLGWLTRRFFDKPEEGRPRE